MDFKIIRDRKICISDKERSCWNCGKKTNLQDDESGRYICSEKCCVELERYLYQLEKWGIYDF